MNHPTDPESRLLLAGQTWRANQPLPPEPDLARITGRGRSPVLVSVAAGVAALVVAAGATVLSRGTIGDPGPASGGISSESPTDNPNTLAKVAVHNGERVRAVGTVIVKPGKVFLCAAGSLVFPGSNPGDTDCTIGQLVPLTGVDVDSLPDVHHYYGTRVSKVTLIGTYRNRTIAVTSVSAPPKAPPSGASLPPVQPPCAAPPGGWRAGPLPDRTALDAYLRQHPDQFGGADLTWPAGHPAGPTGAAGYTTVAQVLTVQVVTGDPDAVRSELAKRYPGNLCLQRSRFSTAALNAASAELERVLAGRVAVVRETGPVWIPAYVPVVDDTLYPKLAAIESRHGAGILNLDVAIRPAG
jgi:hypothetical protein